MNDIGLSDGDIMIYKTNQTHILSAIFRIIHRFADHQSAADWFIQNNFPVPSNNIMVDSLPINQSHARHYLNKVGRSERGDRLLTENWDSGYQVRATDTNSSYFFITEPIYNAVSADLHPYDFLEIATVLRSHYGSVPNTAWRPQSISQVCYDDILGIIS